jgi:hypothetical protein
VHAEGVDPSTDDTARTMQSIVTPIACAMSNRAQKVKRSKVKEESERTERTFSLQQMANDETNAILLFLRKNRFLAIGKDKMKNVQQLFFAKNVVSIRPRTGRPNLLHKHVKCIIECLVIFLAKATVQ